MTYPPKLRGFVDEQLWTFARTMPERPYEYIVRDRVEERLFEDLVRQVRARRREGRFYATVITYYDEAQTYEARLAAGTLPAQAKETDE